MHTVTPCPDALESERPDVDDPIDLWPVEIDAPIPFDLMQEFG